MSRQLSTALLGARGLVGALTRPLLLFPTQLADRIYLGCLQLHLLLGGGLELRPQLAHRLGELFITSHYWLHLVKAPFTVPCHSHHALCNGNTVSHKGILIFKRTTWSVGV
jgi:hypothetical protein